MKNRYFINFFIILASSTRIHHVSVIGISIASTIQVGLVQSVFTYGNGFPFDTPLIPGNASTRRNLDTALISRNGSTRRNMDTPLIAGNSSTRRNMDTPYSTTDILYVCDNPLS